MRQLTTFDTTLYWTDLDATIVHHVMQPFKPTISIEDGIEHYTPFQRLTEAAKIANVNIWSELPATVAACVMDDDSDPIRARYQLRILAIQITYADAVEAFERAVNRWFPQTPTQRVVSLI